MSLDEQSFGHRILCTGNAWAKRLSLGSIGPPKAATMMSLRGVMVGSTPETDTRARGAVCDTSAANSDGPWVSQSSLHKSCLRGLAMPMAAEEPHAAPHHVTFAFGGQAARVLVRVMKASRNRRCDATHLGGGKVEPLRFGVRAGPPDLLCLSSHCRCK